MKLKELKTVRDQERLVALLYNSRHTPAKKYKDENNLLHLAVYSRSLNSVRLCYELLRDCNLHKKLLSDSNSRGETPRDLALRIGEVDIFQWLAQPESSRKENLSQKITQELSRCLGKEGIRVQSVARLNNSTFRYQPLHHKFSSLALPVLLAKQGVVVKEKNILRDFIAHPVGYFHQMVNFCSLFFKSHHKSYSWREIDLKRTHHSFYSTSIKIEESSLATATRHLASDLSWVSLVCSLSDKALQEYFLNKKTKTHNLIVIKETKEWRFYPLTMRPSSFSGKKIARTKARIVASLKNHHYLRLLLESKIFTFFHSKKVKLTSLIRGEKSRFACYHYQGKWENENYNSEVWELIRPIPQCKISIAFYFKNKELCLHLDIHRQIVKDRAEIEEVAKKIKSEIENYIQFNLAY